MKLSMRRDAVLFGLLMSSALLITTNYSVKPLIVPGNNGKINELKWPSHYKNNKLKRLPLSQLEKKYFGKFPGKMARFTDGSRQIIMRWVIKPSRMLHPAKDCFKGLGYKISNINLERSNNKLWRKFTASKTNARLIVREQIIDKHNNVFTDTSSWYWNALLKRSQGPWLAITVAERS